MQRQILGEVTFSYHLDPRMTSAGKAGGSESPALRDITISAGIDGAQTCRTLRPFGYVGHTARIN